MSEIQIMNSEMLEILKNYLEICSFFNEKLEEIKADALLNMNLELLKASIMDLNINIANFKSDLKNNEAKKRDIQLDTQHDKNKNNQSAQFIDKYTELDKKNLIALFFMYLMQIDKDSILNNPNFASSNTSNYINHSQTKQPNVSNSKPVSNQSIPDRKVYDYPELD